MHVGTSPQRFRSGPESASAKESRLDGPTRLNYGFRPTEFLGQLLCNSTLYFLRDLGDIVFCDLGVLEFSAKLLLGCSSKISLFNAASFLLPLRVAIFYGKSND